MFVSAWIFTMIRVYAWSNARSRYIDPRTLKYLGLCQAIYTVWFVVNLPTSYTHTVS